MKKIIILFLILFITDITFAHEEAHHLEAGWNPISAGPVTTWTAPLCGKGKFVLQPFLFYNHTRGTFNSDGHYDSLPGNDKKYQFQQQLFAQYGINDRLEVDGQISYLENHMKQGGLKASANGLADSYLFLRYCLLEEEGDLPHLTGLFQLKLPTGKYQHASPNKLGVDLMGAASGGGSWDHGYGILLSKRVKPFLLHFDTIFSFPGEAKIDGVNTRNGKYLNYDFGIEYFLRNGLNLMLEFNGFAQQDRKQDGARAPDSDVSYLTLAPGLGWSNNRIQALVAYQRIMFGRNTDANDSLVVTLVYNF